MFDVVVTQHIHKLPGCGFCFRQIDAKRLPQPMQRQAFRKPSKTAPMRHRAGEGLRRERLAVCGYEHSFAPLVGGIEDLGKHGRYWHKKPLSTRPSLVLCLNDVKPVDMTLNTIDKDAARDPLVPSQAGDIATTIAEPECQSVAGAR